MSDKNNETQSPMLSMIENILSDNLVESKSQFDSVIADKLTAKLEEKRIFVAKSMFSEMKDDDDDDEIAPKYNDDIDSKEQEELHKTLHHQLKTAQDLDDNPLTDEEKLLHDKRTQHGLKLKAARGEKTSEYDHRNIKLKDGEVKLKDGEAKHINKFLDTLKPEKRQEVIDHMHKSPDHFNSVHDVVKKFPVQD